MGARTWRTTTTCAALLLTTTGCMVGPTIKDEPKKPAAATSNIPTGVAPAPGGQPTNGPAPVPPTGGVASPTPKPKLQIGATAPWQFRDGTQLWVQRVGLDAGTANTTRIVVEVRIINGNNPGLRPFSITVELTACPESPGGRCAPGARSVGDSTPMSAGQDIQSPRYFVAPASGLPGTIKGAVVYNSERVEFEGQPS